MATDAVAMLERTMTERLNAQRTHLDNLAEEVAERRDVTDKALAEIQQDVAVIRATVEGNTALINKVIVAVLGAAGSIVTAATLVILFGPGS